MQPHRAGHADFLLAGPQHDGGQLIVQVPVETTTPLRETPPLALRHSERGRGGKEVDSPLSGLMMRSAVGMPPLERPTARTRPLEAPDLSTVLPRSAGMGRRDRVFLIEKGLHTGGVVQRAVWARGAAAEPRATACTRRGSGPSRRRSAGASDLAERLGRELDRPTAPRRHPRRDPSLFTVWQRKGWRR